VYVAVRWPGGQRVRHTVLPGDRAAVRAGAVSEALALALECLDDYCERRVGSAL
jgi:nicotinamide mononucleotide (NMN) deamidase PncC